jgi:hypothetical protein
MSGAPCFVAGREGAGQRLGTAAGRACTAASSGQARLAGLAGLVSLAVQRVYVRLDERVEVADGEHRAVHLRSIGIGIRRY